MDNMPNIPPVLFVAALVRRSTRIISRHVIPRLSRR
jgi:hypothetical protein